MLVAVTASFVSCLACRQLFSDSPQRNNQLGSERCRNVVPEGSQL